MRKFCITCNTCISCNSCNSCIYEAHLCLDQVSLAVNERTHMRYLENPSSQEDEKQSLRGCERVPPPYQHREQDAGDHQGPPRRSSPPSPLRMVMSFFLG